MADSRGAAQRGVAGGSCAQDQGGRRVGQLRRRGWRRHAARDGRRLDVASRQRGASMGASAVSQERRARALQLPTGVSPHLSGMGADGSCVKGAGGCQVSEDLGAP